MRCRIVPSRFWRRVSSPPALPQVKCRYAQHYRLPGATGDCFYGSISSPTTTTLFRESALLLLLPGELLHSDGLGTLLCLPARIAAPSSLVPFLRQIPWSTCSPNRKIKLSSQFRLSGINYSSEGYRSRNSATLHFGGVGTLPYQWHIIVYQA